MNKAKRILSMLLAVMMIVMMIPFSVIATDETYTSENAESESSESGSSENASGETATGETVVTNLNELAVALPKGGTVKLGNDIDAGYSSQIVIPAGVYTVLDLNAHTLSFSQNGLIETSGTLAIRNGKITAAYTALEANDGGILTIEDSTITATTHTAVRANSRSSVVVLGGTLECTGSSAAIQMESNSEVTIESGTVSTNGTTAIVSAGASDNGAKLTVNNGTIKGNINLTTDSSNVTVSESATVNGDLNIVEPDLGGGDTSDDGEDEKAPDMSGDVINVNASNAQDVLDGKYGDITGKTINFTENITEILDLARPTKYEGSLTTYYKYDSSDPQNLTFVGWSEDISTVMTNHSRYYRTLNGVTFTADAGVTVAGFSFSAGHNHTGGYDYVRDVATGDGVTYYDHRSLNTITFNGLTITGSCTFKDYLEDTSVQNIYFEECTFTGTTDDGAAAIQMNSDTKYFSNVVVKGCTINNYFQGVYVQGVNGLVVGNNTISNTTHNAIAIQSSTSNYVMGTVVVHENFITGAGDRAIRIGDVTYDETSIAPTTIDIENNIIVSSGDSDGELIKASSVVDGVTIELENNYWDGKDLSKAIGDNLTAPSTVGITGGTFNTDVSKYLASGSTVVENEDGSFTVEEGEPAVTDYAVRIGDTGYTTLTEAIAAANKLTDETVTIEIYGKVEYTDETESLVGSYKTINFVGKTDDAEISITRNGSNGYISGSGSAPAVTFTGLICSKPEGYFAGDAGFMNCSFTVYRVASVSYTNCSFPNGACAAGCETTYTSCTFQKSHDKYAFWAYGADITIDNCVFDNDRGIKMYAEGAAKTTSVTVENSDFSKLTGKPAIVLTYGESVTLEGNTYSSTGVFELDADGDPNGTTVTADITDIACKNDNYADCGVLVDGKIYTTITDAATVATSGSTVTLMYNATETAELAEGVTLNKNGYEAANVTVVAPATSYVAQIGETKYESIAAAIDAATNGDEIVLLSDISENVTITQYKDVSLTINGNGCVYSGTITIVARAGKDESNTLTIKNFNFKTTEALHNFIYSVETNYYPNNVTISNCTFEGTGATSSVIPVTMKSASNLVIENCTATKVHSLLQNTAGWNITVRNCEVTEAGRGMSLGSAQGVTIEKVTIDALDTKYGIRLDAAYAATTTIKDCSISAFIPVVVRYASAEYKIVLNGTNTMTQANTDGLWLAIGTSEYETNGSMPTASTANVYVTLNDTGLSASGVYGMYKESVATVNGTEYSSLQEALNAAIVAGDTVEVEILTDIDLTGTTWIPVYFDSYKAEGANTLIIDGNGKTITGLSDMLFRGVWTGTKLEIKDLTIDKANVVHDAEDTKYNIGVGAIIGNVSAIEEFVLTNVKLTNSHVEGGHWTGGFVGYIAGYSGNDGPVFTTVTITGCTVENCTIVGKGSVGGVVGHATGDAWTSFGIEASTITGNTITSTSSSDNKAGIVAGTIGAAGTAQTTNGTTLTGGVSVSVTESKNEATSNGTVITTVYGRQGSSTGKLEITGGTYENNPIEDGVSYAAPADGYKLVENTDGSYGVAEDPTYATFGKTFYIIDMPTKENSKGETTYGVGLFSGINSLDYKEVGFIVTVNGVTKKISVSTVYSTVTVDGETPITITTTEVASNYIYGVNIWFRDSDTSVTYNTYAIDLEGNEIVGEKTVSIGDVYTK